MKVFAIFEPLIMHVERDFLKSVDRLTEFVTLLKELYGVIRPAYSDVMITEMMEHDNIEGRRNLIGTDLKRALPNLHWATFLGPEYVNMFGVDRVLTTPFYYSAHFADFEYLLCVTS